MSCMIVCLASPISVRYDGRVFLASTANGAFGLAFGFGFCSLKPKVKPNVCI
jgi:hypothetical protein